MDNIVENQVQSDDSDENDSFFMDEEKLIEEVITTPYEKVLIILQRIKCFIADLNVSAGNEMCKDLDWIIERISSHTLYTYVLSHEYEELEKYKDDIPEIKNFLDFLTDYSETTRINRNNNLMLSKDMYDGVLQTLSTKMKRKAPSPVHKVSEKIIANYYKKSQVIEEKEPIEGNTDQLISTVLSQKDETKEQNERIIMNKRNTSPALVFDNSKHSRKKSLTLGSLRQMVDEGLLDGPTVTSNVPEVLSPEKKDSPSAKSKRPSFLIPMNHISCGELTKPKQVVSSPSKFKYDMKNILTKNFNIFELEEAIGYSNVLPCIGKTLFESFGVNDTMVSMNKLDAFLNEISKGYNIKIPYHNAIHGADVTQTVGMYLFHSNIEEVAMTNINDILSLFSASLAHDIGHPGTTNAFQCNTNSDIALTYNDQNVLENYHSASFFFISRKPECNIFDKFNEFDYKSLRKRIISLILATDMVNHAKVLGVVKSKLPNLKTASNNDSAVKVTFISKESTSIFDDQQKLLDFIIHLADLSHNSKLFKISQKWTELLMKEFWAQGDTEKSLGLPPSFLCDRITADVPKSQMGFIKGIIIPSFEVLVELFPSLNFLIDNMNTNLEEWAKITEEKRSGITPRFLQKSPKLFPRMITPKLSPERTNANLTYVPQTAFQKMNRLQCPVVPQVQIVDEPVITLVSLSYGQSTDKKDSNETEEESQKKTESKGEEMQSTKKGKKQVLGLFGNEIVLK